MGYRQRSRQHYRPQRQKIPVEREARLWVKTANSLERGKGIPELPEGTAPYKNVNGDPLLSPEQLEGFPMDPTTSIVTAGFFLFGPRWPQVYHGIRVPDKRGNLKRLPDNVSKGFTRLEQEFGENGDK